MDSDAHGATAWRKSRRSIGNGECAEAASGPDGVLIRDSRNQAGAILRYPDRAWRIFLAQAKAGKFDIKNE
jgi:hypothetical protein